MVKRWKVRLRSLVLGGMLVPTVALAQGADQLALTIEQNLKGIEFRLDLRPQQALRDLEEQRRQLDLLERQAPDHPALPELWQEYERLTAAAPSDVPDPEAGRDAGTEALVDTGPAALDRDVERATTLQAQAESEFLAGHMDSASEILEQAERQIADLEERHGGNIPAGHVPLLVVKEKVDALRQEIVRKGGS